MMLMLMVNAIAMAFPSIWMTETTSGSHLIDLFFPLVPHQDWVELHRPLKKGWVGVVWGGMGLLVVVE